jgi:hypothetical protein
MRFIIRILDPDTRHPVHTLSHPVWARSRIAAVLDVCNSYGFPGGAG